MAPTQKSMVRETATGTGTGDLTLGGAVAGFLTISGTIGTSTQFYYSIEHQSADEREVGLGQATNATTFQRDTVLQSTNSGSKVSFSAGTKHVRCGPAGEREALIDSTGRLDPDHAPGMVQLARTGVASSVSSVDFASNIDSTYEEYVFRLLSVVPASDNVNLWLRTSTDAGSTWDSGASDYRYVSTSLTSNNSAVSIETGDGVAQIKLNGGDAVGSDTNENGVNATIHLIRPSAAEYTELHWSGGYQTVFGTRPSTVHGAGQRDSAADVTGVRFLFSGGNIESGIIKLYGVQAST